ncbi:MAG TPA: hypothetical protein VEH27_00990 [Methylomirabilota bacterium]|nr:hypothetical protein [Methylomirabilota bacterium]
MNSRFTLDGSEALESRLDQLCRAVGDRVAALIPPSRLQAVLLGGGYGRGEGGVLRQGGGEEPYNDLEFYVFIKGSTILNDRRYRAALHHLGEEFTQHIGIEVEFKILSIEKLRRSPVSMFYYDLVSAHRLVSGPEGALEDCDHHRAAHRIPLHEAARLLMNRSSGLLYSKELLAKTNFTAEDADFVGRNLAKAKLAMGDVILTAYGQYHFSCRERHRRLEKLSQTEATSWILPFVQVHTDGVEFKLHPFKSIQPREALQSEHAEISALAKQLWLWLENRRLSRTFDTVEAYALDRGVKCPESDPAKNILITARAFGVSAALGSGASRYPRERLLNTLPLLLWSENAFGDPKLRERVSEELRVPVTDLSSAVRAYKTIWNRFN